MCGNLLLRTLLVLEFQFQNLSLIRSRLYRVCYLEQLCTVCAPENICMLLVWFKIRFAEQNTILYNLTVATWLIFGA